MLNASVPIKCSVEGCRCSVAHIQTNAEGEKIIRLSGRHDGKKHTVEMSVAKLLEIIEQAR